EATAGRVPADVLDVQVIGVEAGLDGGVAQVLDGDVVLDDAGQRREVDGAVVALAELLPGVEEVLVDAVELVAVRVEVGQPEPLGDGRLYQSGGSVGVVLEQARRGGAVVDEIEAAV